MRSTRRLAAFAIGLVVTACGLVAPPDAGLPIEGIETTGRELPGSLASNPTGPHVELLTGEVAGQEIEVVMQRDGNGVCFDVRRAPEGSQSCGEVPGENGPFGMVMSSASPADAGNGMPAMVAGLVVPQVASVVAELADGRTAQAVLFPLAPAQVEGSGFVLYLPADAPQDAIVARDADGTELGRLEFQGLP